jgi:hypothetical protein
MNKQARFIKQIGEQNGQPIYDTASGSPEPGDLFWVEHIGSACYLWDNCDGRHLYGVLPNGRWWNIDGRAGNCAQKSDRLHRCWIRHGSPEEGNVHVDKEGLTCEAGAGSIDAGWHGHLHHFVWVGPDWPPAPVPSEVIPAAAPTVPSIPMLTQGGWNPLLGGWEPLKKG